MVACCALTLMFLYVSIMLALISENSLLNSRRGIVLKLSLLFCPFIPPCLMTRGDANKKAKCKGASATNTSPPMPMK